jgi:hypothetical protein
METVAVAGLVGLGYLVSRLANKKNEGFKDSSNDYGMFKRDSQTVARRGPTESFINKTAQGANPTGPNPELDLQYQLPNGQTLPSTPNPTPYGLPISYSTQNVPLTNPTPEGDLVPPPVCGEDQTAQVCINPAGFESNPVYIDGDVVSSLSGENIASCDFRHNNMVPFFGGRVKQNVRPNANSSRLDSFTGSGATQIRKQEVEQMFNTSKTPFGNPFGLESSSDFIESRINNPRSRNGERPFEPVKVGAGVGERGGILGKGGFQQIEVNEVMRPRTTDDLRTANNPKLTYTTPMVPGKHFVGGAMDNAGEVRKYRPDRFYIDETNSRAIAGPAAIVKEAARPVQVLPETTRATTSTENFGSAAGQDTYQSYVAGAYRTPMSQQYGGAGYRNADMSSYMTKNTDSPEADYGRSGYENRPNERATTNKRNMGLNLKPAESGQVTTRYTDNARPTRRAEMEAGTGSQEFGHAYGGAAAVTVWDPNDVARTTVKETTINLNWFGPGESGSMPNKLRIYDPNDIARPTQKAQLSQREYTGSGYNPGRGIMNEDFAYNMRLNPNKQEISKGRKPIAGNGSLGTFNGTVNQRAKKLTADDINNRTNAINRVESMPPGQGDIGEVKFRVPLNLDVSSERLTPDIVAGTDNNPLQQSLAKNAALDAAYLSAQRGY